MDCAVAACRRSGAERSRVVGISEGLAGGLSGPGQAIQAVIAVADDAVGRGEAFGRDGAGAGQGVGHHAVAGAQDHGVQAGLGVDGGLFCA